MGYLTDSEGSKLWFDVQGEGDPLALIGGSSLVHRQWDFMVPILRDHVKVILFDQRGAGLSDRTPSGISLDAWVEDLKMILDALHVEQTGILSTSNGSLIAIRFAARYPDRVNAIVHYGIYRMTDQYRRMSRVGETIIKEFGIGNGGLGAYLDAGMERLLRIMEQALSLKEQKAEILLLKWKPPIYMVPPKVRKG